MIKKIFNIKRLNSFFFSFLALILLELLVWQPILFWPLALFILALIFFSVWRILPKNAAIRKELRADEKLILKLKVILKIFLADRNYTFFISPVFLFFGILIFIIFLKNKLLIHFSILFFAFLYFLFLESIYSYFYKREEYFLENIFTVINFFSLFLVYSGLFSFLVIFGFSLWKIISVFILFTVLSNHQLMHIYQVADKFNYFYNIAITIVMVEMFWVLMFLPTNFYVNGMVLISLYYSIMGISYFYLKKDLSAVKITRHLVISVIIIAISLATARWT